MLKVCDSWEIPLTCKYYLCVDLSYMWFPMWFMEDFTMADLHSNILDRHPPPPGSYSLNFTQFLGNFDKTNVGAPLEGWRPHLGEILNPSLFWVNGWRGAVPRHISSCTVSSLVCTARSLHMLISVTYGDAQTYILAHIRHACQITFRNI